MSGILYIVATPIGNLNDITLRAIKTLQNVDAILAEDTRVSARLLQHLQITKPLHSLHQHNEPKAIEKVIQQLQKNQNIALISDAGTPLISDPGRLLVHTAHQHHIKVEPIPGPCALIAALSAAGMSADQFQFLGFLPAKTTARQQALTEVKDYAHTLICYEAPHRILATLADLSSVLGPERQACICRELTKLYETIHHASLAELHHWIETNPEQQQGEFVVIIQGAEKKAISELDALTLHTLKTLLATLPLKQAVQLTADITGLKKNLIYTEALKL